MPRRAWSVAGRGVLGDARRPNSLKVKTCRHPVGLPGIGRVLVKRGDRIGELIQKRGVRAKLVGVGVEAVDREVVDPRPDAGLDDPGDQFETPGGVEIGIRRSCSPCPCRAVRASCSNRTPARVLRRTNPSNGSAAGRSSQATRSRASRTSSGWRRRRRRSGGRYCSRVVSRGPSGLLRLEGQREGPSADVEARDITADLGGPRVESATEPAGVERLPRIRGARRLPDLHRSEVRTVRGSGSFDPLHDRRLARLDEQPISYLHRRMQADLVAELVNLPRRQPERPAGLRVAVEPVRDDRVQSVVAADELDDDEDAVVRLRPVRGAGRIREEAGGRRRPPRDERAGGERRAEEVAAIGEAWVESSRRCA